MPGTPRMTSQPVVRSDVEGCAILTLNRPERLNAISDGLLDALDAHLDIIEKDGSRALVLTGCGRSFCVGSDLKESGGDASARIARMHRLMLRLDDFPKPSVAAVNGYALGGGLELALGCTFRVASSQARFGLPEIKLSVMPCYGATQMLPRMIGASRALDMMLGGEPISAETALDWGLADRLVTTTDELLAAASTFAISRSCHSRVAENAIRQAMREGRDTSLAEGLAVERHLALQVACSPEALAGVAAFRSDHGEPETSTAHQRIEA